MSVKSVMPSNHLILCCPLLLLPSIFPCIRVFSNESARHIRWLNYWSLSIRSSNEYSLLISFNTLSRLVITFLPRSKHLLISWLQSPSVVILEPPKIKSLTVSIISPSTNSLPLHHLGSAAAAAAAAAKSLQSCPTLCDPTDGSPSGSPVPGILQARIPEWVAISFSNA